MKHVSGRYEVGMLWREQEVEIPDNRLMAVKRLESTERKLKRDKDPTLIKATLESLALKRQTSQPPNSGSCRIIQSVTLISLARSESSWMLLLNMMEYH